MKKLSEKGRRVLRVIYSGLGAIAVPLFSSACDMPDMYGMPPDRYKEDNFFKGQVKSKKTGEPIPGIGIWIKDVTTQYAELTDSRGEFYFYVPKQENYTIIFTDIDGDENGGDYEQHTETITREKAESLAEKQLIIFLKKATEEAETNAE